MLNCAWCQVMVGKVLFLLIIGITALPVIFMRFRFAIAVPVVCIALAGFLTLRGTADLSHFSQETQNLIISDKVENQATSNKGESTPGPHIKNSPDQNIQLPDFEIIGVENYYPSPNLAMEYPLYFDVHIINRGHVGYNGTIFVEEIGGLQGETIGLQPNEIKKIRIPHSLKTFGPDMVIADEVIFKIDPNDNVKEINENNNTRGFLSRQMNK